MLSRIRRALDAFRGPDLSAEVARLNRKVAFQAKAATMTQGSGVPMNWRSFDYENNAKLKGSAKWDTLREMENDPHIKGSLRSTMLPLLRGKWELVAASDTAKDIEIRDFVAANLLRESTDQYGQEYWVSTPWRQRLFEIMQMLPHGFSMFSVSMKRVGTKRVFDRIHWLEPSSVDPKGWHLNDKDELESVDRTYQTPEQRHLYAQPLQAADLMIYPWEFKGARFEGRPFIRSMFGAWFRKDFMLRMAAIWVQKVGAPVPMGVFPQGWSTEMQADFQSFVEGLVGQAPAEHFGMFEKNADGESAEVKWAGADTGEVDRMGSLVRVENQEIGHGGGTSSQMLGETETGSRALGESKGSMEMEQVEAVGQVIAEYELHGPGSVTGLIERLVRDNFATRELPMLRPPNVNPFGDFGFKVEAWKNGIIPKVAEARKQLIQPLGLELEEEDFEVEPAVPFGAPPAEAGEDEPEAPATPEEEPEEVAAAVALAASAAEREKFRQRIAPLLEPMEDRPVMGAGFRRPTRLEATVCDLAAVSETFRTGERDVMQVLRSTRRRMIDDLLKRLRAGKITARNLDGQRRSKFHGQKRAHAELLATLTEIGETGAEHVDEGSQSRGPVVPIGTIEEAGFTGNVEVLATMDLGKQWDRLLDEFLSEWGRLSRDETLSATEIERTLAGFMDDLSEKPMQDLARQSSSVSYNQGRGASIETAARTEGLQYVVRSELLDANTCAQCIDLDGSIIEIHSPAFQHMMPPAMCLGGDRCRGFYVPIAGPA